MSIVLLPGTAIYYTLYFLFVGLNNVVEAVAFVKCARSGRNVTFEADGTLHMVAAFGGGVYEELFPKRCT